MTLATFPALPPSATDEPITMLNPDFPFSYDRYLEHPAGLGSVPAEAHGTRVAVIGAGLSGLVAAYELMKLGLRPVVYESAQIGGRLRTAAFPGAPDVRADLGGMRFPTSGRSFYHYVDLLGLARPPFPNPLAATTPSTVLDLGGRSYYAETAADLPPFFGEVADAWTAGAGGGRRLRPDPGGDSAGATSRRSSRSGTRSSPRLDDPTFYGFLAQSAAFREHSFAHREIFGQVGFGSGGWDTDFPNSMLEILRVVYTDADDDHRGIVGGAQQLPAALWKHAPEHLIHWPAGTSLASLHGGAPRGAVRLHRPARATGTSRSPRSWGNSTTFDAAIFTCQSWLLLGEIHTRRAALHPDDWTAIERTHYMESSKTFVPGRPAVLERRRPATGRRVHAA